MVALFEGFYVFFWGEVFKAVAGALNQRNGAGGLA